MAVMDVFFAGFNAMMAATAGPWPTLAALGAGIVIPWMYMLIRPPPPKRCGTRNGPPITAPRIRLRDGRYLAYKESGVPKDQAKNKLVFCHPFGGSRNSFPPVPKEVMEELSLYTVTFDRPGYGESDPFPQRSVKSQAEDIEQLADQLQLGDKFYVMGLSMGGFSAWGCLKYIPHRLAGVAVMAPAVNYWWPDVSNELLNEAFQTQTTGDKGMLWIAHNVPWLLHLYSRQALLPCALTGSSEKTMNKMDRQIVEARKKAGTPAHQNISTQQGVSESLHRDLKVQFGKWGFFPGNLPNTNIPVHIWQGDEDNLVPVTLQRHIHERLPWSKYNELPGMGHMLDCIPGMTEKVLAGLVKGT